MRDQPHNDAAKPKKLLDEICGRLRLRDCSYQTEKSYVSG